MQKNHQLPFINFRVMKEKNFVLLNSLKEAPRISHLHMMKGISPLDEKGFKVKLRNPHKMISSNQPSLGTYNPKLDLIEKNHNSLISFDANVSILKPRHT
mmetsp:Transcript_42893/g.31328  ORF Transcript_42893/g.31328 Transcript_42893/m.31328 type:complete len:100 (+) Transcript_42893:221-520(+)